MSPADEPPKAGDKPAKAGDDPVGADGMPTPADHGDAWWSGDGADHADWVRAGWPGGSLGPDGSVAEEYLPWFAAPEDGAPWFAAEP